MAALGELVDLPPVDLDARIVYFPVRHHSPACAWHVDRLIRDVQPAAVLIEGPRDATPLVPLLVAEETRMPVALYTTYVRRAEDELPERHAAYYPLCDFSPELAAIRAGLAIGAAVKFIDLTFPEKVEAHAVNDLPQSGEPGKLPPRRGPQSLQEEGWLAHNRLLKAACVRTGSRDPDDLWDHLYEVDCRSLSTADFIRNVLAYCALARRDFSPAELAAEGTLAREQAMATAIAEHSTGRVVVVTGGFHTVALPTTSPIMPQPLKIAADDHQLVLMRYSFEQLDRLNGYASGMPSPEFYQRMWEDQSAARLLVEVARQCRKKNFGVSTADAIAAVAHSERLAVLRGHATTSREDVLDGVRSVFIKGADDAEGVAVLAIARKLLAGDRVGNVPASAGQPPIVHDFRNTAAQLRLKLDKLDDTEAVLDLYRKSAHRDISRLFHRLAFLGVPFATFLRGPDFVAGSNLQRIQEAWKYHWSPQTESTLIERSLYGSTVEEAATSMLLERFAQAEAAGQGRSAADATHLIIHACRMGLHRHTQDLLDRVGGLLAEDAAFPSLVGAMDNLLILQVSREPLEAHHLHGLPELALAAYRRACFIVPTLVNTPTEEEAAALDALNSLLQAVRTLGDSPDLVQLRTDSLQALAATTGGSAALRGGAVGILFADGQLADADLVRHLRGHLLSSRDDGLDGPSFLRGLLMTARNVLWQVPECLASLNEVLHGWDEARFVKMLPALRLALADLTPRETDQVAKRVAVLLGTESLQLAHIPDLPASEMLRAVEVNRLVGASLAADGLEALLE
ncbi:MAG: DUF5682 family protein [Planctomycetaceae bacterium]|nr:DUF5682 family protein [Planctomycetaceae bacterium]